jgi:hypothetical protein
VDEEGEFYLGLGVGQSGSVSSDAERKGETEGCNMQPTDLPILLAKNKNKNKNLLGPFTSCTGALCLLQNSYLTPTHRITQYGGYNHLTNCFNGRLLKIANCLR